MDNQTSPELRLTAKNLQLTIGLVNANQKEPSRSERAIQTAKHHIIATRAGFHQDCPHIYLDKCLGQIELTLNLIIHPYEYDPTISAYHEIFGTTFDFMSHPISPAGSKVPTWNAPNNRWIQSSNFMSHPIAPPVSTSARPYSISGPSAFGTLKTQQCGSRQPCGGCSRRSPRTTT